MSIFRSTVTITSAAGLRAVQAAVADAASRGVAVVACAVDPGGALVACLRADGAFAASVDIARDKAWTAAIFGISTDDLCKRLSQREVVREGLAMRPGVVLFGGGAPLRQNGNIIGGIGVSGGSEDDDRAGAAAGLRALGLD
ncbi:heme-binding protein [Acidocella sp.]|uniref:GlcG/HbpS family heme-binding protein n=1 Tax=Acidocella sp. TaxID=50710 RepID=UPI00184FA0E0|nr:heme-binding protein [Acidocella sp.]NNM55571.1 heme-binding protein [Acidocella sp.]